MADYRLKRSKVSRYWAKEKWDEDGEKADKMKKRDIADLFATWSLGSVDDDEDPTYWQYEADVSPTILVEE